MKNGIVFYQGTNPEKVERSRELRRDMTPAEKCFWDRVRNRRLDNLKFRRQQIIDGFIVDFFCDEKNLVVEIDGSVHDEEDQKIRDAAREEVLKQRGLVILRVRNEDVLENFETVAERIRGERPHPPGPLLR